MDSEVIDAVIIPVDEDMYLPAIVDGNNAIIYCWGFSVSSQEAKRRATAEYELRMWLKERPKPWLETGALT